MATKEDLRRYRGFLDEEVDGLYIYHSLANLEADESIAGVYRRLAAAEQRHLELWQSELRKAGEPAEPGRPSLRARILMWLARRFGPELVLPVLKTFERDAVGMYAGEPVAEEAGLPADESSHARLFAAIASSPGNPPGSVIARIESRHRSFGGSNALRAAVLGANDGLTSNLALVAGVAGAAPGQATVLLAGIAGLLAGSFSMALGEWVSVTAAQEAAEAQLKEESEELRLFPESERQELSLIYQAKGFSEAESQRLATRIIADHDAALGTLAREELGIVPEEIGSPWTAAITSFILFALGAVIPLIAFFFGSGHGATLVAALLSGMGLFALGAAITLLTGRHPLYGGSRQAVLGLAAALLTFIVGRVIGGVAGI